MRFGCVTGVAQGKGPHADGSVGEQLAHPTLDAEEAKRYLFFGSPSLAGWSQGSAVNDFFPPFAPDVSIVTMFSFGSWHLSQRFSFTNCSSLRG